MPERTHWSGAHVTTNEPPETFWGHQPEHTQGARAFVVEVELDEASNVLTAVVSDRTCQVAPKYYRLDIDQFQPPVEYSNNYTEDELNARRRNDALAEFWAFVRDTFDTKL